MSDKKSRPPSHKICLYFFSFISCGLILCCIHSLEFKLPVAVTKVPLNIVKRRFEAKHEIFNKVREMNKNMENTRFSILSGSDFSEPILGLPKTMVIHEDDPNYFEITTNASCVININITWNKTEFWHSESFMFDNYTDESRLDVHQWLMNDKYYRFTGNHLLCGWINNDTINYNYGKIYNYTCNTDIKLASTSTPIEPLFLNSRNPTIHNEGSNPPPHLFEMPTVYRAMQIFTKSVISELGEPFCGNLQVLPDTCFADSSLQPNNSSFALFPYYTEIFVISQNWGGAYFHRMIENLPRTVLFLEFLTQHPSIKILARDKSESLLEILETLGLSRDRVITGWTRADIAYVPRTTSCGTPNMLELQFFQHYNLHFIMNNLLEEKNRKSNSLVLIKRSGFRRFTNQFLIEQLLNKTSSEFDLKFVIFGDNPPPSLSETMVIFSLASVVVAPHGAGLSNLVFSRPGTLVIEGLCNKPLTNLCYHRTSYALGMRWYGIPSVAGCENVIDVDGKEIDFVLRTHLQLISGKDFRH